MSPFIWLRQQVAQAVISGWHDGLSAIGKGDQAPPAEAVETVGGGEIDSAPTKKSSTNGSQPGPLAGLVDQLRLATTAAIEKSQDSTLKGETRKPPRKHPR
jgi:hypothetical protein